MADLLIHEHKKNDSGSYDNVYRKTKAKMVEAEDGETVEQKFADVANHIANKDNPHSVTAEQTGALPLSGGAMRGNISMGSNKITNLSDPISQSDAATKNYVDNVVGEIGALLDSINGEVV